VPQRLAVLGSTGSIGTQTLDIVRLFPSRLRVHALAAGANADLLADQALEFEPSVIAIGDASLVDGLASRLASMGSRRPEILHGPDAPSQIAESDEVDVVMAAIVGAAGLPSTLAAARAGKRIALANKESLVAGGALVTAAARRSGAVLLPVDSEHSALFQCLVGEPPERVERLTLTASGGAFRDRDLSTFDRITPADALAHPTWSMGAKVTIDSATMMNKGLEVIEARWLFGLDADRIDAVVHPQVVVHSLVTFVDGSAKAQLGLPSMKLPIQYALTYPDRWPAPHPRLDWREVGRLDFRPPDPERYPCLGLAFDALRAGGRATTVLNAANEVAVAHFLEGRIRFLDIAAVVSDVLAETGTGPADTLDAVRDADARARRAAEEACHRRA
jgi:1-deoxy-D-xylulose-5-phosphate reductoisomerase